MTIIPSCDRDTAATKNWFKFSQSLCAILSSKLALTPHAWHSQDSFNYFVTKSPRNFFFLSFAQLRARKIVSSFVEWTRVKSKSFSFITSSSMQYVHINVPMHRTKSMAMHTELQMVLSISNFLCSLTAPSALVSLSLSFSLLRLVDVRDFIVVR